MIKMDKIAKNSIGRLRFIANEAKQWEPWSSG